MAYELRISDWSSDVCSSDLDDLARAIDEEFGEIPLDRLRAEQPRRLILERAEQRIGAVAIDLDLGEDREGNVVGQRAETGDFRGIARFLPAELVARNAQHPETARAEAALERPQPYILRGEADIGDRKR